MKNDPDVIYNIYIFTDCTTIIMCTSRPTNEGNSTLVRHRRALEEKIIKKEAA